MGKKSPTQRTIDHLNGLGYYCEKVEHWNPWSKTRHDLFGFVDVLALGDNLVIGVQATTKSNMSARMKKISNHENLCVVLACGIKVCVFGWDESKKPKIAWLELVEKDEQNKVST